MESDLRWKKKLLISYVFAEENRLHAILDRNLKEITCRQWFLLVTGDSFPTPPSLTDLASVLGCTRQNIKKLALSLEESGYAFLSSSPSDKRTLCLNICEKGKEIISRSKELEYRVENLSLPLLVLQCRDDKLAKYSETEAGVKRIPGARFVSFDSGGHLMKGHKKEVMDAVL